MRRASASIRSGQRPVAADVERLLERAFGELMALEAAQRRPGGHSPGATSIGSTANGDGGAAGDATADADAAAAHGIEELRTALSELRIALSGVEPHRVAYGFVLPRAQVAPTERLHPRSQA